MRIRSAGVVTAAALAFVAGLAAPAFAHEEINPKTFVTGQPTYFTLSAANEEKVDLVKIVVHAPPGLPFGGTTRSPAGWSVNRTDDTITWTGGAVKPDNFDNWGFEIEGADQPGTLPYKVTLGFADGKADDVEVDITATAPGAAGATPPSSSATVTTGAASPSTAQSGSTNSGGSTGGGSDGTAKAALALAILALVVAAGALVAGARQRSAKPPAGGGGAPGSAGAAQDW